MVSKRATVFGALSVVMHGAQSCKRGTVPNILVNHLFHFLIHIIIKTCIKGKPRLSS